MSGPAYSTGATCGRPPARPAQGGWWSSMTSPPIRLRPRVPATLSSAAWESDHTMARIDIHILGGGKVSPTCEKGADGSEQVRVRCVAGMRMEAAQEKAAGY